MKKLSLILGVLAMGVVSACSYGGVAASNGKAVVARNDMFLFGALRKTYVCDIADGGLTNCASGEAP